jgi:hypothetical protein
MDLKRFFSRNKFSDTGCQVYKNDWFELKFPSSWEMTDEDGILNFFPGDDSLAVTISFYHDFPVPYEKTKEAFLEMNQVTGHVRNVKEKRKGDRTDYTFEYIEGNTKWYVNGVRKGSHFYFISGNSFAETWESSKKILLDVINSFRLI